MTSRFNRENSVKPCFDGAYLVIYSNLVIHSNLVILATCQLGFLGLIIKLIFL